MDILYNNISSEQMMVIISNSSEFRVIMKLCLEKNTTFVEGLKVVYLQHGLTDSSDTWIVNDEHLAPGFYFANKGYDVWFGNVRGNKYSNPTLSPTKREFWDFTFDQMA